MIGEEIDPYDYEIQRREREQRTGAELNKANRELRAATEARARLQDELDRLADQFTDAYQALEWIVAQRQTCTSDPVEAWMLQDHAAETLAKLRKRP